MNDLAFAEIVAAYRARVAAMSIRCSCGHVLGEHAIASPHGCAHADGEEQPGARASCACEMFQAAEPELGQGETT